MIKIGKKLGKKLKKSVGKEADGDDIPKKFKEQQKEVYGRRKRLRQILEKKKDIDDADNGIYAFYNTRLLEQHNNTTSLEDLMSGKYFGKAFSPREASMSSVWNTLTTVVSPSYESMADLNNQIKGATITYFASHIIPQSINKLHIGG